MHSDQTSLVRLTVFRQTHLISPLICLVLAAFVYWSQPQHLGHAAVLVGASLLYLGTLWLSYAKTDLSRLYLTSCGLTLFLIGYFLSVYPLLDSPALPWLCILPSLLMFFLDGRKLLICALTVGAYLSLLLSPVLFKPTDFAPTSSQHTVLLVVSMICALSYASFLSMALCRIHSQQRASLQALNQQDPLTGAFNRRALESRAERRHPQPVGANLGLGILMLDIDDFKKVNDTHGHDAGDAVLKAVAQAIKQSLRQQDMLVRYGGEEFVVLFESITCQQLKLLSHRILDKIRVQRVNTGVQEIKVTVSGGSVFHPDPANAQIPNIIHRADNALYEAKMQGKDQILHCA